MAKLSGSNRKKQTNWALVMLKKAVNFYVFLLMVIYPLYYQDKYFNMGEAKWIYFKNVSIVMAVIVGAFFVWYLVGFAMKNELTDRIKSQIQESSLTDKFVMAYLICCLISTVFSINKELAIWGYDGWYMGIIAQTGFVIIYFFVSRFWRWDPPSLIAYLAAAFVVFLFGVLMRFNCDPMEMYIGLQDMYKLNFLSTLGQATWYSSYMCILFPLGLIGFWYYDGWVKRTLLGVFTAMGFMTMVTQNSDSAYVAFGAIFFVLFWISLESSKYFKRFLEVLLTCFSCFKIMGLIQIAMKGKILELDKLSTFMSQSVFTWIMLVITAVIYAAFVVYTNKNEDFDISKFKLVRVICLVLIVVFAIAIIVYIVLNSTGALPEKLSSDNNYLLFDEFWGNNRGSSWTCAVGTFIQCNPLRKIIGAGPDSFAALVYEYYADVLFAKWGESTVLSCAHNEWLNCLITGGILGFVSYVGIFVTCFARCMKRAKEYPEVYAVAISIAAYMCHNFFCYQQIICTPVIFILMGGAEAIIQNGYEREVG